MQTISTTTSGPLTHGPTYGHRFQHLDISLQAAMVTLAQWWMAYSTSLEETAPTGQI